VKVLALYLSRVVSGSKSDAISILPVKAAAAHVPTKTEPARMRLESDFRGIYLK
jgi:hypothetical protein